MKINQGSFLYHTAHGLCCVKQMNQQKESGQNALFYTLEPKTENRMKMRFIVPAADIETSGFHQLISTAQANGILKYFKEHGATGLKEGDRHEAVCLAEEILAFSHQPKTVRDQRSRQRMERSVSGLVGEMAIVLKTSLREMATMIRGCLGDASKINPFILTALENIGED